MGSEPFTAPAFIALVPWNLATVNEEEPRCSFFLVSVALFVVLRK